MCCMPNPEGSYEKRAEKIKIENQTTTAVIRQPTKRRTKFGEEVLQDEDDDDKLA